MSNKFGLDDPDGIPVDPSEGRIDLSGFAPVKKRLPLDLNQVDAAGASHGFVSREAASMLPEPARAGRRRRAIPAEPTRHLAIRMIQSQYDRFVRFADLHKLTYHDAITKLLDAVDE